MRLLSWIKGGGVSHHNVDFGIPFQVNESWLTLWLNFFLDHHHQLVYMRMTCWNRCPFRFWKAMYSDGNVLKASTVVSRMAISCHCVWVMQHTDPGVLILRHSLKPQIVYNRWMSTSSLKKRSHPWVTVQHWYPLGDAPIHLHSFLIRKNSKYFKFQ